MVINGAPATDIQATLTEVGRRSNGPGVINLAQAKIANVGLFRANLIGANLSHADLSRADRTITKMEQSQLDPACGVDAKLPAGLTLKPCPEPK